MQVTPERNQRIALEFNEAVVAGEFRERARIVLHHVLRVEGLEISIAGRVKQDEYGHHF